MKLTRNGKAVVAKCLNEMQKRRNEILDAGLDTADETTLPTEQDILSDILNGLDGDGDYVRNWNCTDHCGYGIFLSHEADFVVEKGDDLPDDLREKWEEESNRGYGF
ncbi:hypothetical protein ACKX2L_06085 [Lachnospiraceae bacterium YH-ros2228]